MAHLPNNSHNHQNITPTGYQQPVVTTIYSSQAGVNVTRVHIGPRQPHPHAVEAVIYRCPILDYTFHRPYYRWLHTIPYSLQPAIGHTASLTEHFYYMRDILWLVRCRQNMLHGQAANGMGACWRAEMANLLRRLTRDVMNVILYLGRTAFGH